MRKILFASLLFAIVSFANAQTILHEDFGTTSGTDLPVGWIQYSDANANHHYAPSAHQGWITSDSDTEHGRSAVSVSYLSNVSAVCDRWLVTPSLDIDADNYALRFLSWGYLSSPIHSEKLKVLVSTTTADKSAFTATLLDLSAVAEGWEEHIVDLSAYYGQTIYIAFLNYASDAYWVRVDDVDVFVMPTNEIVLNSVEMDYYVGRNRDSEIRGSVTNRGAAPLVDFEVSYSVNGGAEVVDTISGIDIPYNGTYDFVHSIPFNESEDGLYNVAVSVSNPNGAADDVSDNTQSGVINVYDIDHTASKMTLMENFTTGQCTYCPSAHERLTAIINRAYSDKVIWVAHHVGYYTDALTIDESNQFKIFFNASSTYAPAIMFDRTHYNGTGFSYGGSPAPGPVFFPAADATLDSAFRRAVVPYCNVSVSLSDVSYDAESRQLQATVSGEFLKSYNLSDPRVSLWLVEDGIRGVPQVNGAANYVHNHVLRACISDVWGDTIDATSEGATFSKSFQYTLPTYFKASNCYLVAFVNEGNHSNVNNCPVLNSMASDKLSDTDPGYIPQSISVAQTNNIVVYPNPVADVLHVESAEPILSVSILNTLGIQVLSLPSIGENEVSLDVLGLSKGVYLARVSTAKGTSVQRITIVR